MSAVRLLAPIRSSLLPVPTVPQPGVCTLCHSSSSRNHTSCYACAAALELGSPEILPIALSLHGGPFHRHLRGYKDGRSHEVRSVQGARLAALLALFVEGHGHCLGPWDLVTAVPSERRVAMEPVLLRCGPLRDRYRPLLRSRRDTVARPLDPARFRVLRGVAGTRVLVVDDTFASGARLFSAVAALRDAGASVVGPVVLGRHISAEWEPSRRLLGRLAKVTWDPRRCARCEHRAHAGPLGA